MSAMLENGHWRGLWTDSNASGSFEGGQTILVEVPSRPDIIMSLIQMESYVNFCLYFSGANRRSPRCHVM